MDSKKVKRQSRELVRAKRGTFFPQSVKIDSELQMGEVKCLILVTLCSPREIKGKEDAVMASSQPQRSLLSLISNQLL